MNYCRETAKMGGPRAAQALAPRAGCWFPGVPEWYVAGGRHPRTPGFRLVEPTARREGRPYPGSQSRQGVNS